MSDLPSTPIEATADAGPVSVLATKLFVPRPRPDVVPRARLLVQLDRAQSRKLTLVSAPSGFGKTTLVCEWLRQSERAAAWVSLDEGDNDLVRFWTYVIAALGRLQAGIGQRALGLLQSQDSASAQRALTLLLNDLAAVPSDLTLVLDDYHTIQARPVHESLGFLLDHLPEQVHVFIATRADPPLPLARLRACGQLAELRAADLRFTLDEAAHFLQHTMGLPLSATDVAALENRTEGWIAGLHLAALSMQGHESVSGFVAAFTGSHAYILDYLTEEVLLRQTEEVQRFLLSTSILERLSGPLCDSLLDQASTPTDDGAHFIARPSSVVLQELERANLFLVPLDEARQWYRYHHLFGELLRHRLHALGTARVNELHARASHWYEQHGYLPDAIHHALASQDLERAARLVEAAAPEAHMRSELGALQRWFAALPEPVMLRHPGLCIYHAAVLFRLRQFDALEARLKLVAEAELPPIARAIHMALAADLAQVRGDTTRAYKCAREALAVGELAVAEQTGQDMRFAVVVTLFAVGCLELIQANRGQLREATATTHRGLHLARKAALAQPWTMALTGLQADLAGFLYEADDLEAAARYAQQALDLSRLVRYEHFELQACLTLVRVKLAEGMPDAALELTRQAEQSVQGFQAPFDKFMELPRLARAWLAQGNRVAAEHWAQQAERLRDEFEPDQRDLLTAWPEPIGHVRARLWLARGRPDQAAALLAPLRPQAEAAGQLRILMDILVLQALAHQAQGDLEQALGALQPALTLAEPEGYIHLFVDEGAPMAALLQHALAQGIAPAYVEKLLARLPSPSAATVAPRRPADPEALSLRELEVLQWVAQGLSNQEIAGKLFIAVGTVKRHINNIFGKLGVTTRIQAVTRARQRHLL
jgi:LuxR family transcriptional regulator, maltose regulon positive regulatory protein